VQVGLPANILPKAITVRAVAKTPLTDKMAVGVRVGGVDYMGAEVPVSVSNYSDLAVAGRWVNDPSTNSPWTLAHLNTAGYEQIIYKHTSA
jgi:hypothetical protein